jgi:hypothetical protein
VAIQELLFAGNGKAAMMDLRKDVLWSQPTIKRNMECSASFWVVCLKKW